MPYKERSRLLSSSPSIQLSNNEVFGVDYGNHLSTMAGTSRHHAGSLSTSSSSSSFFAPPSLLSSTLTTPSCSTNSSPTSSPRKLRQPTTRNCQLFPNTCDSSRSASSLLLRLRRQPSSIDLALAAERCASGPESLGLELLEPRPLKPSQPCRSQRTNCFDFGFGSLVIMDADLPTSGRRWKGDRAGAPGRFGHGEAHQEENQGSTSLGWVEGMGVPMDGIFEVLSSSSWSATGPRLC